MKEDDLLEVITGLLVQRRPARRPAVDLAELRLEVFIETFRSEMVSLHHRRHEPNIYLIRADTLKFLEELVNAGKLTSSHDENQQCPATAFEHEPDYPKLQKLAHHIQCPRVRPEDMDVYAYLRFSKREQKRQPLLEQLRRLVDRLNVTEQKNIPQCGSDKPPRRLVPHFVRDRLAALRLALQAHVGCASMPHHIPSLRLMVHCELENNFKAPVAFNVFFPAVGSLNSKRWQEARISVEYQESESTTSPLILPPQPGRQHCSLCERISTSLRNKSALQMSLKNGSFIPLRSLPHAFNASRVPQYVRLGDVLSNVTQREPEREIVKEKGRLVLAVILANALIPLLGTSFLPHSWNRDSFLFFYDKDRSDRVDVTQPFLIAGSNLLTCPTGNDTNAEERNKADEDFDSIHPIPSLLSLAVLLCELATGWPIETQFEPDDYVEQGKPSINAAYAAVEKVLREMENSIFEDYRHAIEACLKCDFLYGPAQDPSQIDFSDEGVRQSIYLKVVQPLEKMLEIGFGVKPSQLDKIARDEWLRYWGKRDPYQPVIQSPSTLHKVPMIPGTNKAHENPISKTELQSAHPSTEALLQFELFDVSNITVGPDAESEKWIVKMSECVLRHLPQINTKTPRVKIAILDTGYDASHPFLQDEPRIKDAASFVESGIATRDVVGHGTHALGILLQFAPHADIYVAQISNSRTLSRLDRPRIADAIRHAVKTWDVDFISMSFGLRGEADDVRDSVYEYGIKKTMFAAASNDGGNLGRAYPANDNLVICVHSTDGQGNRSKFSPSAQENRDNFGILGESVMSYWPAGLESWHQETRRMSGTSVATPIAVGFAATALAFAREHVKQGDERLVKLMNTPPGIAAILATATAKQKRGGYEYITPWTLFEERVPSHEVYGTIRKALKDKFG